ncbi:DUF6931 family protein [Paracoccus pacificus]|uniref:DUF6931 family protein n=1 Tax=Paracoccus pacificus TaxID=1463598 RepID=A0ABW4R846_9RHOB
MADKTDPDVRPEEERTRPPVLTVRAEFPSDLYRILPEISELTQQRPRLNESGLEYLLRLRSSTTPEEAVTFTAFAALPELAVNWGYECLRAMAEHLNPQERPLMEMIASWLSQPNTALRHRIARDALWATSRAPSVFLGLGVAWSGGSVAPNDPVAPPPYRAPRAINSAVLSCLARSDLNRRPIYLARFIDLAEPLFRAY